MVPSGVLTGGLEGVDSHFGALSSIVLKETAKEAARAGAASPRLGASLASICYLGPQGASSWPAARSAY